MINRRCPTTVTDDSTARREDRAPRRTLRLRSRLGLSAWLATVLILAGLLSVHSLVARFAPATSPSPVQQGSQSGIASSEQALPEATVAEEELEGLATVSQTVLPLIQTETTANAPAVEDLLRRGNHALADNAFEEAVGLFASASAVDPSGRAPHLALAEALAAWGWNESANGRYEAAVEVFRRGIRFDERHAPALTGLGYAYAQLHRDDEAIAVLQRATKVDPSNSRVHEFLGELYDRRNDLHRAADSYRQALALSPNNAVVAARVGRLDRERARQDPFVQAVTRHFTIQFDGRENRELSRTALGILEEAYGEVGRTLGYFPAEATTVILYSQQQFQDITRLPQWAGAVFDGKIRVPTDGYESRPEVFRRILYHEYVHAWIHAKTGGAFGRVADLQAPRVPVWLHEGLAQYFEPSSSREVGDDRLAGAARRDALIPLSSLEGSFMSFGVDQAAVAYAQSRSVVAYLIDRYGMDRVDRLLDQLADHQPIDAACREAFSMPCDRVQNAWQEALVASRP